MGGLYSYFDSKDTLLLMILGEVDTTMREVLDAVPDEVRADPRAHLRWVVDAHVRLTEVMQPWFAFVFMEAKSSRPKRAKRRSRPSGWSSRCWRKSSSAEGKPTNSRWTTR